MTCNKDRDCSTECSVPETTTGKGFVCIQEIYDSESETWIDDPCFKELIQSFDGAESLVYAYNTFSSHGVNLRDGSEYDSLLLSSIKYDADGAFLKRNPIPNIVSIPDGNLRKCIPFQENATHDAVLDKSGNLVRKGSYISNYFLESDIPDYNAEEFSYGDITNLTFNGSDTFVITADDSVNACSGSGKSCISFLKKIKVAEGGGPDPPEENCCILGFDAFFGYAGSEENPLFVSNAVVQPLPGPSGNGSIVFTKTGTAAVRVRFHFTYPDSGIVHFHDTVYTSPGTITIPYTQELDGVKLVITITHDGITIGDGPGIEGKTSLSFIVYPPTETVGVTKHSIKSLIFNTGILIPDQSFDFNIDLFESNKVLLQSSFPSGTFDFDLVRDGSLQFSGDESFTYEESENNSVTDSQFEISVTAGSSASFVMQACFISFLNICPEMPFFLNASCEDFPVDNSEVIPYDSPYFEYSISGDEDEGGTVIVTASLSDAAIGAGAILGEPNQWEYTFPSWEQLDCEEPEFDWDNPDFGGTSLIDSPDGYSGAVVANNGLVYFSPGQTNTVLILDPSDYSYEQKMTFSPTGGGDERFRGGVLSPNGKIYFCPRWGDNGLMVVDPTDDSFEFKYHDVLEDAESGNAGGYLFSSSVIDDNGKMYILPFGGKYFVVVDTINDTAEETFLGLGNRPRWCGGGVLANNGKIYAPSSNDTGGMIVIIDTSTGIATESDLGVTPPPSAGTRYWDSGALANNGKIYFCPRGQTSKILVIDTSNDTAVLSDLGADLSGGGPSPRWRSCALAPNGKIYCVPLFGTDFLIIDPSTETAERNNLGLTLSSLTDKWSGAIMAKNGKVIGVPYNTSYAKTLVIGTTGIVSEPGDLVLSSKYNKY